MRTFVAACLFILASAVVFGQEVTKIEVFPDDATVAVGETVQFELQAEDSEGIEVEVESVEWSIDNTDAGAIDNVTGLFTAIAPGEVLVTAAVGSLTATANVVVQDIVTLPEGVNTITLQRQHPDGKITLFGAPVAEGSSITLGGMPFPFNYLNGGNLYFPENSLDDDIVITIKIPSFAKMNEQKQEISFDIEAEVLSVVTFEVSVEGEAISPFYFNEPLVLTLPYKRGVLRNLGIEPENLTYYYVNEEGQLIEEGIGNVQVDLEANTITGNIAHFSNIAIAPEGGPTIPVELPSAVVGTNGGRIDLSTIPKLEELGLDNLFVDIPQGGVKQQIRLQVKAPTSIPAEKAAAQAVEFIVEGHENGFTFEKPVTIGIPYPENVTNETALTVMYWDPTAEDWSPIDLPQSIVLDKANRVISAQVTHFSIYAAIEPSPTSVNESAPATFALSQNFPNPFNPSTTISYQVPATAHVQISIYNSIGQHVVTLVDGISPAGNHSVVWNGINNQGKKVTSGIFFYTMTAGDLKHTRKLLMMK